jgi:hypothetical protein
MKKSWKCCWIRDSCPTRLMVIMSNKPGHVDLFPYMLAFGPRLQAHVLHCTILHCTVLRLLGHGPGQPRTRNHMARVARPLMSNLSRRRSSGHSHLHEVPGSGLVILLPIPEQSACHEEIAQNCNPRDVGKGSRSDCGQVPSLVMCKWAVPR